MEATREPLDSGPVFSRVLVPVNFSAVSRKAVHTALELQRCCDARVCVFHVSHGGEDDGFLAGLGSPADRGDLTGGAGGGSAAVRRFVSHIAPGSEAKVECDAAVGDDYVAAIREKVQHWRPTLVVLSHLSHSSLLRTHSEKLTQSLNVPVLLLHPLAADD